MKKFLLALLILAWRAVADIWIAPGAPDPAQTGGIDGPFLVSNTGEMNAHLTAGETVHLAAGTYEVDGMMVPGDRSRLIGAGMGRTILHRVKDAMMYALIQNEMARSEGIEVSGLTIDCNETSAFGIILFGSRNTVRDVHVLRHISPVHNGTQQESFAILLTNGSDGTQRIDSSENLIEGCRVTDFLGNYDGGIVISGWPPPRCAYGTVRNCSWIGSGVPDAGFDFSGVVGAQVTEGCTVQNAAIGTYLEGGGWGHTIIRNNRYLGCRTGIRVAMSYGYTLENLVIEGNYFEVPEGRTGILVTSDNAMKRVAIRGNRFVGKTGAWCSLSKVPYLTLYGNSWDAPLTGSVTNSGGMIGENFSSDGQYRTRAVWLKKPKPVNQLKVVEGE